MISRHQLEAARARAAKVGLEHLSITLDLAAMNWATDNWSEVEEYISGACTDLPAALDALEEFMQQIRLFRLAHFCSNEHGVNDSINALLRLQAAYDADAPTRAGDGGEG